MGRRLQQALRNLLCRLQDTKAHAQAKRGVVSRSHQAQRRRLARAHFTFARKPLRPLFVTRNKVTVSVWQTQQWLFLSAVGLAQFWTAFPPRLISECAAFPSPVCGRVSQAARSVRRAFSGEPQACFSVFSFTS